MVFLIAEYSFWAIAAIGIAAMLYSSVGHGGASGYLAAMALFGFEPQMMKPAALTMNLFVTALVLARTCRKQRLDRELFVPIVAASMPMAFLGGTLALGSPVYKVVVGLLLLLSVWRMLWQRSDQVAVERPVQWLTIPVGGVLGFVAGSTGVGGGIFLSPLLLLFRWTDIRGSIPVAAGFIFLNSAAGLLGFVSSGGQWPAGVPLLVTVAVAGAFVGTGLATNRLDSENLRRVLAAVLAVAGLKMMLTA